MLAVKQILGLEVTGAVYRAIAEDDPRPRGIVLKEALAEGAGARFQDALQLVVRLVIIGDCKSLACHPASTTPRQLSPDEMAKAGVSADMVRLSIGIEHIDDILADLDQALQAA